MLTSIDSCHCDSHCLAPLFENLPAISHSFCQKEKPGVALGIKARDDRFTPQSKQILEKDLRGATRG